MATVTDERTAAPNDYGVFEDDVCEVIKIPIAKSHKSEVAVYVVEAADGWRQGYDYQVHASGGGGSSPSIEEVPWATREDAVETALKNVERRLQNSERAAATTAAKKRTQAVANAVQAFREKWIEAPQPHGSDSDGHANSNGAPKAKAARKVARRTPEPESSNGEEPTSDAWKPSLQEIPLKQIEPNPWQPRVDFDQASLDELAESIKTHGLRQPVEVRLVSGLPEPRIAQIIDGERRYRACKRAGLKQIACVIKEASDQEMAEVAMVANEQRKDLSLIEKARGYQRMMEEFGLSQRQLAQRIGKDQSTISNLVRILPLPQSILDRVIAGEITPAHCRCLATLQGQNQQLLDMVLKDFEWLWADGSTVKSFEGYVESGIQHVTKPVNGGYDYVDGCGYEKTKKLTAAEQKECQVVDVGLGKKTQKRALNVKKWTEIQKQAIEARSKNGKPAKKGQSAKPSKEDVAKRNRDKRERFTRRLYQWKIDWLRWLCFAALAKLPANQANRWADAKLLLYLATSSGGGSQHPWRGWEFGERSRELFSVLKASGLKVHFAGDTWKMLSQIPAGDLGYVVRALLRCALWVEKDNCPNNALPPHVVEGLVKDLAIDLKEAWALDRGGQLTEEYFSIHTIDQLKDVAKELDVYVDNCKGKAGIVKRLLSSKKPKIPAEILKAKG